MDIQELREYTERHKSVGIVAFPYRSEGMGTNTSYHVYGDGSRIAMGDTSRTVEELRALVRNARDEGVFVDFRERGKRIHSVRRL